MGFETERFVVAEVFRRDETLAVGAELAGYLDRLTRTLTLPYGETAPDAPFDERIARIGVHDPAYAHLLGAAVATDAHRSPLAHALARDVRLTQTAEALDGMTVGDRTVRFRGNSSLLAEHRCDWHSDVAVDDGTVCSSVKLTCWIPLVDTGPETGGLGLAAGRRSGPALHVQDGGDFAIPDEAVAGDPKVSPSVPMGSCLLIDRFTPHRSLLNRSGKTR